jgi:hypothetical protein
MTGIITVPKGGKAMSENEEVPDENHAAVID